MQLTIDNTQYDVEAGVESTRVHTENSTSPDLKWTLTYIMFKSSECVCVRDKTTKKTKGGFPPRLALFRLRSKEYKYMKTSEYLGEIQAC